MGLASLSCSDDDSDDGGGGEGDNAVAEPELRDELLAMQAADQAERTGEASGNHDEERTDRLREIIAAFGWPTWDLVGRDGATAAWLMAQHSDLDVEFQRSALELLREAVEDGQASPGDLAYLEDRVAANSGEPQVYGTQIGCVDGHAVAGTIRDPEHVDERRAEVGLPPLEEYLASLEEDCAAEAAATEAGRGGG
jgi:hypothetical protein